MWLKNYLRKRAWKKTMWKTEDNYAKYLEILETMNEKYPISAAKIKVSYTNFDDIYPKGFNDA